jgi:hypothetical protein
MLRVLLFICFALNLSRLCTFGAPVHVWEKQELTFTSTGAYLNPYTDVVVWVDLVGPNFKKRIYGFWNGGSTFAVRILATAPGTWSWTSGSTPDDPGLSGKSGSFTATDWSEADKQANPLRRGMIRATANHHALEHADGTPYFAIGDTWFALAADRFKWKDGATPRDPGPDASFQDYVRYRKAQGYNWVCVIAAFPNWSNDGQPYRLNMNDPDHTPIRFAWREFGTESAKNMDNEGGKPFAFPGRVPGFENVFPDVDRVNPEYFKYLDRKIDYLNAQGFVPFVEVTRRDCSLPWKKYYGWPDSYARFVQYIFARYQANITVLAPVHLDIIKETVMPEDFTAAVNVVFEKFGPPPFGTLLSANSNPSSLTNWGADSWVTLHQTGNRREHTYYSYLTEIYHAPKTQPALNGEPYYAGYKDVRGLGGKGYKFGAEGGSERDDLFCRSGAYGSSFRAVLPAMCMAPRESGAPTLSPMPRQKCGTRFNGDLAPRCSTSARSRSPWVNGIKNSCRSPIWSRQTEPLRFVRTRAGRTAPARRISGIS